MWAVPNKYKSRGDGDAEEEGNFQMETDGSHKDNDDKGMLSGRVVPAAVAGWGSRQDDATDKHDASHCRREDDESNSILGVAVSFGVGSGLVCACGSSSEGIMVLLFLQESFKDPHEGS